MITEIDAKLLEKIADLTGKPAGAFNIRKDMGCEARQSTEHIAIDPRADGKPGIDIHFKAGTKGETCHIPVIISQTGMSDMVYNDFYVADDCDVTIVAGCGIHNSGCDESRHDGTGVDGDMLCGLTGLAAHVLADVEGPHGLAGEVCDLFQQAGVDLGDHSCTSLCSSTGQPPRVSAKIRGKISSVLPRWAICPPEMTTISSARRMMRS